MKKKYAALRGVILIIALILFGTIIYYANHDRPTYHSSDTSGIEYEVARVTGIVEDTTVPDAATGLSVGTKTLQVQILTGRYQGDTVQIENYLSTLYNVNVKQGAKISVRIDTSENGYQVSVYNYYRVPQLIGCVAVFLLLLILIGGKKGAKSAAALIFTMVCIIWILLPLALKGYSALLITIILIFLCSIVSFVLTAGVNKKAVSASVSSFCGVLAGAGFALIAQKIMTVTTYQMDEAETLLLIMTTTKLQIKDLLLCGVLIACIGAVMDVAMSITSSVMEVHRVNPERSTKELFRSGMIIGRDAMGTMANTLILAFAGSSLNMMLMIYSYGVSFQQLMNTDFIAIEVIQSIAGSIGIIFTVPIAALIAAASCKKNSRCK